MGISSTGRQVAVVASSLVAAAWMSAAGPAGATAEDEQPSSARLEATTGVCGWFAEEFPDRYESVNVCGYDGVVVRDGRPEQLAQPLVVIDRFTCFAGGDGDCVGERHELVVDRRDFVVDPFLRRATIDITAGGCPVEVEFVGTSAAVPGGGVSEYHGIDGGPWLALYGDQTLARPAQWWGRVCGRFLVADPGEGHMWRSLNAGVARFPAGAGGPETA
ncbi:MAG: hypothetical protein ACRDZ7_08435 [Acidimicrobiia bacterium]